LKYGVRAPFLLPETTNLVIIFKTKKCMGKFTYRPQFGVIVICKDEADQVSVYDWLTKNGLTVKVVAV
jgi:hypothetical protein